MAVLRGGGKPKTPTAAATATTLPPVPETASCRDTKGRFAPGNKIRSGGWQSASGKWKRAAHALRAAVADMIERALNADDHIEALKVMYKNGDGPGFMRLLSELDRLGFLGPLISTDQSDAGALASGTMMRRIEVVAPNPKLLSGFEVASPPTPDAT